MPRRAGWRLLRRFVVHVALGLQRVRDPLQLGQVLLHQPLGFAVPEEVSLPQFLCPQLPHARVALDRLVHQRLGERRIVAFVVPVTAVADQVDQEIAFEPGREGVRDASGLDARLGVVRVDVNHRES